MKKYTLAFVIVSAIILSLAMYSTTKADVTPPHLTVGDMLMGKPVNYCTPKIGTEPQQEQISQLEKQASNLSTKIENEVLNGQKDVSVDQSQLDNLIKQYTVLTEKHDDCSIVNYNSFSS